jgi:hypothetical protein
MDHLEELETSLVDSIIQEYGVNVDATRPANLTKTKLDPQTRVFEVQHSSLNAFIIDTPMTRKIACHPHVVGNELEKLTLEAAEQSLPAILELSQINTTKKGAIVFEQILRAAPGYNLHQAASRAIPGNYRTVNIRPRYTHTSYRDHDGMVQRQLDIVYEDFAELPANREIFLIMQDTVASSKSAEVSIKAAINHCEEAGSHIAKWILYGFIALEGLKLLDKIARSHGIPLVAFAMGNLTALCANNYDMPLYGVDEWLWRKDHSIHKLGSLLDRDTFVEYLHEFVPGSDQPGDWSARQSRLFNGQGYERGDIAGHLENSIRLMKSLLEIGEMKDWQEKIASDELLRLERELEKVRAGPLR